MLKAFTTNIFYRKSVLISFFIWSFYFLWKVVFFIISERESKLHLVEFQSLSLGNEYFNLFSVITCVITILLSCMCFVMKSQRNNCPQKRVFIEDGKTTLVTSVKKLFFTWLQQKKKSTEILHIMYREDILLLPKEGMTEGKLMLIL